MASNNKAQIESRARRRVTVFDCAAALESGRAFSATGAVNAVAD